jgi:hypothetical protein
MVGVTRPKARKGDGIQPGMLPSKRTKDRQGWRRQQANRKKYEAEISVVATLVAIRVVFRSQCCCLNQLDSSINSAQPHHGAPEFRVAGSVLSPNVCPPRNCKKKFFLWNVKGTCTFKCTSY